MSEMHERDYNDYYRIENEKIRSEGSFAPFTFLCTVIILICAGLLMLYSASYPEAISNGQPHYYFVLRQGIFALLGIACAAAIYFIPMKVIRLAAIPLVVISAVFMLLTSFSPYGVTVLGARRWLDLPLLPQFQPSELVKLSVIIFISWWFSSTKTRKYIGWYYVVPLAVILIFTGLILMGNSFPHTLSCHVCCGTAAPALYNHRTCISLCAGHPLYAQRRIQSQENSELHLPVP